MTSIAALWEPGTQARFEVFNLNVDKQSNRCVRCFFRQKECEGQFVDFLVLLPTEA